MYSLAYIMKNTNHYAAVNLAKQLQERPQTGLLALSPPLSLNSHRQNKKVRRKMTKFVVEYGCLLGTRYFQLYLQLHGKALAKTRLIKPWPKRPAVRRY